MSLVPTVRWNNLLALGPGIPVPATAFCAQCRPSTQLRQITRSGLSWQIVHGLQVKPALLAQPRLHDQRVARHADASAFFRRDCYLLEGDVGLGAADRRPRLSGGYGQRVPGAGAGHHEPPRPKVRDPISAISAPADPLREWVFWLQRVFQAQIPAFPNMCYTCRRMGRARLRAAHGCGPRTAAGRARLRAAKYRGMWLVAATFLWP